MQVILLEKIQKVGNLGEVANVKAGYARNFLIPQGKAKPATKANMAEFEAMKAELEAKEAATLAAAQALEAKMTGAACTIKANAGDEGKLFGSITTADIVAALAEQGFEVAKRDVNMSEAIRHTGEYEVSVSLHSDISVAVQVVVEAEGEDA